MGLSPPQFVSPAPAYACTHVCNFLEKAVEVQALALERALQHGQLVQHAPQRPDVTLPPVSSAAQDLGRHIQRSAHLRRVSRKASIVRVKRAMNFRSVGGWLSGARLTCRSPIQRRYAIS